MLIILLFGYPNPLFVVFQLHTLSSEKSSLHELWEERRILYEQCMDLQLFIRDTEQADAWMTKQEVHTTRDGCLTVWQSCTL